MSFLKRLIVEDLAPLLRWSSSGEQKKPSEAISDTDGRRSVAAIAPSAKSSRAGRKVVILNWSAGENDPFSVINATIRQHFHACGKNAEVLEIATDGWVIRLAELAATGVELVLTWQGIGSSAAIEGESVWERFRIPLICLHGDHPSHMPLNHQLESRYCFHLYTNADFARYSNRHFRRSCSASVIDIPQLHNESRLTQWTGDYFVFAKNINDPVDTETRWRQQLPKPTLDSYLIAAETLKAAIMGASYIDIHDVLDQLIVQNGWEHLNSDGYIAQYHYYHSQLDHYLRSYKSIVVVNALREFPLRIYGRGWNRIAQRSPVSHVFEPGRNMADSQDLYYTRFGLVDVSPSKRLHDRTRRAMVNGCGFLSSANLEDSFPDIARFDSLFFSFRPNELPEKCAAVVREPEGHRSVARQFADRYHDTFHFRYFVNHIDQLGKLASAS